MENSLLETKDQHDSFLSFINRIQSTPPEFGSGGDDSLMPGTGETEFTPSQNGGIESLESGETKDEVTEPKNGNGRVNSLPAKAETKPSEFKQEPLADEQGTPFLSSFLIELIHCIKNSLASIFNTTLLTIDRLEDGEFKKDSQGSVTEEIKKIDAVLNSLLNFININTPIIRTNTFNLILEEILEANEKQIQDKNVRVFRKCEKDLPETFIHHEQVRFILHSMLQYALISTPAQEAIGFVIKPSEFHNGSDEKKTPAPRRPEFIDVVIGFTGENKTGQPSGRVPGVQTIRKEEPTYLILKLVEEILQKNNGMMKLEVNGKRPKTLITLRFPVERRKVVYYEPIQV